MKSDNICNYESVSKRKGIGEKGEKEWNELNICTISDLTEYVSSHGLPKIQICGFVTIYGIALK